MSPPYTAKEKAVLKKHWRNEYYFLRAYQLDIYKAEDRKEGRRILRACIAAAAEKRRKALLEGQK